MRTPIRALARSRRRTPELPDPPTGFLESGRGRRDESRSDMLRPWQKDTRISLASLRKSSKVTQLRSTYGDSAGLDRWDDASGRPIQSMRPTEGKAPSVGAARSEARHSTAKSSRPRKVGEAGQPKRNGPRAGMATRSMKALSRKVVERGHHRLGRRRLLRSVTTTWRRSIV